MNLDERMRLESEELCETCGQLGAPGTDYHLAWCERMRDTKARLDRLERQTSSAKFVARMATPPSSSPFGKVITDAQLNSPSVQCETPADVIRAFGDPAVGPWIETDLELPPLYDLILAELDDGEVELGRMDDDDTWLTQEGFAMQRPVRWALVRKRRAK